AAPDDGALVGSGGGTRLDGSSAIKLFRLLRPFGKHRLNPGHFAPQQTQPARLLELSALLLQPQMQTFLPQIALLRQKLVRAHLNNFFYLHTSLGSNTCTEHRLAVCAPSGVAFR